MQNLPTLKINKTKTTLILIRTFPKWMFWSCCLFWSESKNMDRIWISGVGFALRWNQMLDPDPKHCFFLNRIIIIISVPDPHVFWPRGSGSISQRYGSGSGSGSYHQAKKVRKPLSTTVMWILDFLSLKNDVNLPSKSNTQKNFYKRKYQDPDPNPLRRSMDPQIRILVHTKMSWIRYTINYYLDTFSSPKSSCLMKKTAAGSSNTDGSMFISAELSLHLRL